MANQYLSKLILKSFGRFRHGSILLLLLMLAPAAFAQQTITGTVTDEANAALPGATVHIKDTDKATATGTDGKYRIAVSGPGDVLVFSFVGSVAKEVIAGTQTVVNISLASDAQQLKDVVVIGYGTANKADILGAVASIKSEDFN